MLECDWSGQTDGRILHKIMQGEWHVSVLFPFDYPKAKMDGWMEGERSLLGMAWHANLLIPNEKLNERHAAKVSCVLEEQRPKWLPKLSCEFSSRHSLSLPPVPMASLAKQMVMCHTPQKFTNHQNTSKEQMPRVSPKSHSQHKPTRRLSIISTLLASSAAAAAAPPSASAQSWGGRSFIWERYFEPALSPEDAAARIRQTAEGMRSLREMLDTMCWKYVMAYIRLKQAYLESDLKNAFATLPPARRSTYVKTANELVDNMTELDIHVRTPKIYESYLYYEKTLKSLDDLVALLA